MDFKHSLTEIGNNLKNVIATIIDPKQMSELARTCKFVQRFSSRLKGDEFVQTLLIESIDGASNTLRDSVNTLTRIRSESSMSVQALGKRMNSINAIALMEGVFKRTLQFVLIKIDRLRLSMDHSLKLLDPFPNVYIQDSSECALHHDLKDVYRGSGGGNGNGKGEASVKINMIYEYKNKLLKHIKITDRKEPESVLGNEIVNFIKQEDLIIRDLGYSCISSFKIIHDMGAYFLSRLQGSLNVYLNQSDILPISLGSFLEKKTKKSGLVDVMVYIGNQRFPCRLVAYKAPPDVEMTRRKEYLKECRKKKRKPNKEYLKRLPFTIFITNVLSKIWPACVIGTIYRLRWQVELIFKSWKSDLEFNHFLGTNVCRIQCLLYARLTVILMIFMMHSCIDSVALALWEKETSMHKVISWLTKNGRWLGIILYGFTKNLWNELINSTSYVLCKEKRKQRKTTLELIQQEVAYGIV